MTRDARSKSDLAGLLLLCVIVATIMVVGARADDEKNDQAPPANEPDEPPPFQGPFDAANILEGRILHLQARPRPDLERDATRQYMVVAINRTVTGRELSGTVILSVQVGPWSTVGLEKRGVRLWGTKKPQGVDPSRAQGTDSPRWEEIHGEDLYVLDPGYWREGAKVSIGAWTWCYTPRPNGLESDPREEARLRFGDEGFHDWVGSPQICISDRHLFKLDRDGFVLDADPPQIGWSVD